MTHPAMTHRSQTPHPDDSPQARSQTPTAEAPATPAQTLPPTGPAAPERPDSRPSGRPTPARLLLDVVRGGLIGAVETVPGVSGGTVALVVGLYESLIGSCWVCCPAGQAPSSTAGRRGLTCVRSPGRCCWPWAWGWRWPSS